MAEMITAVTLEPDIEKAARKSDVPIYTIGLFDPLSSRNRTPEEASAPGLLAELWELSGDRVFSDVRQFVGILKQAAATRASLSRSNILIERCISIYERT
jgi:hypothetical protein